MFGFERIREKVVVSCSIVRGDLRTGILQDEGTGFFQDIERPFLIQQLVIVSTGEYPCLLYTSDAADE